MKKSINTSGIKKNYCAREIRLACALIVPLVFLSVFISAFIISITNDMYAFVKPSLFSEFTVNSPLSPLSFSLLLEEKGIIENPFSFFLYCKSKGKLELISSFMGELRLNSSMSYREILLEIAK